MNGALARFAELLERSSRTVTRRGDRLDFSCPCHPDVTPSASAAVGAKVPVVARCQVCGDGAPLPAMLDALNASDTDRDLILGRNDSIAKRPADVHHDYRDPNSHLPVLRVLRWRRNGKTVEVRRQYFHAGEWRWPSEMPKSTKPDTRSLLYRAEGVIEAARDGETVHVGEGEQVVDALVEFGLPATCNAGGASDDGQKPKWTSDHAEQLRGASAAVVWADNDSPGCAHAKAVAESLTAVGVHDVRVVGFPDTPEGFDVVDWLTDHKGHGMTRGQVRDELLALVAAAPGWEPASIDPIATGVDRKATPWDSATDVHDFVAASEPETDWLVPNLVMRGAVTMWVSPRGLGKTLLAHWIAADLARQGLTVLLIDRDNPPRELRRRLRAWGLEGVARDRLKVITRDKAPPLTDVAGWRQFPVGRYDLVILDAFDSATEGVGEQDSSKSSVAVAALLDVVRGTVGPAALILGNTIKSGSHGRGSGVVEDRLDVIYEVRDATGFAPSGTKDWWLELPAAGRDAWGDRASRRKRRDTYRLAFVSTKFRVGEEPDPFAFEVACGTEPWTVANVTLDLVAAGERAVREAAQQNASKIENARQTLAERVASQGGIELTDEAIPFLMDEHGLSRNAARDLVRQGTGHDWSVIGGKKGAPRKLIPPASHETAAGNGASPDPHEQRATGDTILADGAGSGRQQTTPTKPASSAPLLDSGFLPDTQVMPSGKDLLDTLAGEVDR